MHDISTPPHPLPHPPLDSPYSNLTLNDTLRRHSTPTPNSTTEASESKWKSGQYTLWTSSSSGSESTRKPESLILGAARLALQLLYPTRWVPGSGAYFVAYLSYQMDGCLRRNGPVIVSATKRTLMRSQAE